VSYLFEVKEVTSRNFIGEMRGGHHVEGVNQRLGAHGELVGKKNGTNYQVS